MSAFTPTDDQVRQAFIAGANLALDTRSWDWSLSDWAPTHDEGEAYRQVDDLLGAAFDRWVARLRGSSEHE